MRQQLDTTRLKQELRNVVEEVEHILAEMPETNVGPVAEFKARAGRRLHDARTRLDDLEIQSVERVRQVGKQAKGYVQQHPWAVIGGASAMAFVLGMLSRTRH